MSDNHIDRPSLGILLQDARRVRQEAPEACAAAIGATLEQYQAYEAESNSPSLPELELLAYHLSVPISYFWGHLALSEQSPTPRPALPARELAALRNRIIAVQLRQARQAAHLSVEQVAAEVGLAPEVLAGYEAGQTAVPIEHLGLVARRLNLPLEHFVEGRGPAGESDTTLRALERVRQLPPELREFVSRPVNESYLRLAHQLSELPAEKLRGIAASLLEITY